MVKAPRPTGQSAGRQAGEGRAGELRGFWGLGASPMPQAGWEGRAEAGWVGKGKRRAGSYFGGCLAGWCMGDGEHELLLLLPLLLQPPTTNRPANRRTLDQPATAGQTRRATGIQIV